MKYNKFNEVEMAIMKIDDKFHEGEDPQRILRYVGTLPFLFNKSFLDQEMVIRLLHLINNNSVNDGTRSDVEMYDLCIDIVIDMQDKDNILENINAYNAKVIENRLKVKTEVKIKYNDFNEVANDIFTIENKFEVGEDAQSILKYIETLPFLFHEQFLNQEKAIRLLDLINNGSADDDKSSMRYVHNLIMDIIIEIQNKDILKDINEYNVRLLKEGRASLCLCWEKIIKKRINEEKEKRKILVEKFLNYDKNRADIEAYDEKILIDENRGSWDLWDMIKENETFSLAKRDPRKDVKKSGVVGIDFGTKSTVVVYQEDNDYTLPMRIGIGRLSKAVEAYHYENPTVMELINVEEFMEDYKDKEGRPETKWNDLTISHTANNSFLNSSSEHYYSYFTELKQWCGNKDKKVRIKDKKNKAFDLPSFLDIKDGEFNPIEIYAYYLGSYINNMHNGIYLKYIMSFPVTYEKEVRKKVIESFYKGIKKSLPISIIEDAEIMEKFKIEEGASEPAAYAISALQGYGFEPENEEKVFYGVFDFGGGTTDFDFGIWRGAVDEEEDRYDYVIEHFGAGGDRYLGGENLLELLAFEVFKNNIDTLRKNNITFLLPHECKKFPGCEMLLAESEEAKLNMRQLMEKLRPITEQHENYKENLEKGFITINLYDSSGKQITNISLNIDLEKIEDILEKRIEKGVRNFFEALRLSFKNNLAIDVEKINIFLAGNSSKSKLVKGVFEKYIENEERQMTKNLIDENVFEVYPALGTEEAYIKQENLGIEVERNSLEKPTGKTGVAFGLVNSRRGSTIKVVNKDMGRDDNEVKFKFFIGRQRRKKFKVSIDKDVKYNQWIRFIDAMEREFELYYTTLPEASTNNLLAIEVKRITLSIDSVKEEANIYIRVVEPSVIEYVVAYENDVTTGKYLSEITKVRLE